MLGIALATIEQERQVAGPLDGPERRGPCLHVVDYVPSVRWSHGFATPGMHEVTDILRAAVLDSWHIKMLVPLRRKSTQTCVAESSMRSRREG
jgi:hypothetical protein